MTPKEFHDELLNLPQVSDRFLAEVRGLQRRYPYFQALPLIIALGEKQRQDPKAGESLHAAAAYSGDRSLLKELMSTTEPLVKMPMAAETASTESIAEPEQQGAATNPVAEAERTEDRREPARVTAAPDPVQEEKPQTLQEAVTPVAYREASRGTIETDTAGQPVAAEVPEQEITPGESAERVMAGLAELRERMNLFTGQIKSTGTIIKKSAEAEQSMSTSDTQSPAAPAPEGGSAAEPEQPSGIAAGQDIAQVATAEKDKKEKKEKREGSKDPNDQLLDEIKSKRKRQKPDSDRQVEQMELIDKFISNKPTRRPTRKAPAAKAPEPVAAPEPPPSAGQENYSENVVSETLVDLLIRQGKKEKAIEVLRKLIWKFPQKKALFAARIQELSQ